MAPEDSKNPFMRIPWTASLLKKPNTIIRVPQSRIPKRSGEDALFADFLKSPRGLRSCICFYQRPAPSDAQIAEVSTLITLGDGLAGHVNTMHGGIVATVLDEAVGILQMANFDRDHLRAVQAGKAQGEMPEGYATYTAQLTVKYLKPVTVPGVLMVTARYLKREGRKEWVYAELKQREGVGEEDDGVEVVCATAEALMVEPKWRTSKL